MGDFQQREPTTKLRGRLGRPSSYGALLQEAGGRYDGQATPVRFAERHGAAQTALDRLAAEIRAARFDALVVFGDGQKELFHEDNLPALMVHTGGAISHRMRPPKPEWVEWFAQMQSRYHPVDDSWQHPVEIPLANHLVEALVERTSIPPCANGSHGTRAWATPSLSCASACLVGSGQASSIARKVTSTESVSPAVSVGNFAAPVKGQLHRRNERTCIHLAQDLIR